MLSALAWVMAYMICDVFLTVMLPKLGWCSTAPKTAGREFSTVGSLMAELLNHGFYPCSLDFEGLEIIWVRAAFVY